MRKRVVRRKERWVRSLVVMDRGMSEDERGVSEGGARGARSGLRNGLMRMPRGRMKSVVVIEVPRRRG